MEERSRARSVEEFVRIYARFFTEESVAHGMAFQPRSTDVIVTPYVKCGTTWMQQIVHGLRTGGSMAFGEITEVVPWIERAHDLSLDLEAKQAADPRAFKSHLDWHNIPKGGRYIVVFREPEAACLSSLSFVSGWVVEPGAISAGDWINKFYIPFDDARPGYWKHLVSWWEVLDRDDVLGLIYEDMLKDLPGTVRRVAEFMGIDAEDGRLEIATRQASFDFMKAHADQFDDNLVRRMRNKVAGLPESGESSKVALGPRGRSPLGDDLKEDFEKAWRERVTATTGLADYDEFCASVRSYAS